MKLHVGTAIAAAALMAACGSTNKETRTASNTGTTQQGTVEGGQATAGTAATNPNTDTSTVN
jgi:uncharacterized lipoprotein